MALITLGPAVIAARGKVASVVYQKARTGFMMRGWIKTPNPKTPWQQANKALVSSTAKAWISSLTQAQRIAWINAALQHALKGRCGDSYTSQGINFFVQRNRHIINAGGTQILNPPLDAALKDSGPISATAVSSTQTLTLTVTTALPGGYGCLIYATPPLSQGMMNFRSFWHQIGNTPATLWSDTFAGTVPVPPWTGSPSYNAAYWSEASNTLTASGVPDIETIYHSAFCNDYAVSVSQKLGDTTDLQRGLIVRLQSTGQGYALGFNQTAGNQVVARLVPSWQEGSGTNLATYTWAAMNTSYHTWLWTASGTTHTIKLDGTQVMTFTDTTLRNGWIGLRNENAPSSFQTFTASPLSVALPTPGNISAPYIARYGPLISGKRIGIKLRYVNLTTGQTTPGQSCYADIS